MNSYAILVVFSYSIAIAAVVGLLRYQKVTPGDRPFFYIVWFALINEILSEVLSTTIRTTAINSNIYVLIEALLYVWLFDNWSNTKRRTPVFKGILVFLSVIWILDNGVLNSLKHTNSLFRIVSSFVLVFLAIDQINQLITTERSRLMTNARFLISNGVVIFFRYRAIVEVFYWINFPFSNVLPYEDSGEDAGPQRCGYGDLRPETPALPVLKWVGRGTKAPELCLMLEYRFDLRRMIHTGKTLAVIFRIRGSFENIKESYLKHVTMERENRIIFNI
jgi:hypothetical protein